MAFSSFLCNHVDLFVFAQWENTKNFVQQNPRIEVEEMENSSLVINSLKISLTIKYFTLEFFFFPICSAVIIFP